MRLIYSTCELLPVDNKSTKGHTQGGRVPHVFVSEGCPRERRSHLYTVLKLLDEYEVSLNLSDSILRDLPTPSCW